MGELALITAKHPAAFAEGPSHEMFVESRFSCTIAATLSHRGTILRRPEWKTIPWSNKTKGPKDFLVDIFVELPYLLERFDAVIDCTDLPFRMILAKGCLEYAIGCERSLVKWLETAAPRGWGIKGCRLAFGDATPADIRDAHSMCLFWTTYSQVLTTIQCLLPLIGSLKAEARNARISTDSF
ncbi:hypothetical protein B0T16DRAFT_178375 [Cercophora newfieldiana]|uniref:Uncharacterized protein n=1 Tax=Cercophora newfieldiana TaxID=92897 RepID=A0AA39Y128_9PEZI|nr:hypothetical protein B0T16DRAFT_178375 [Cercophora newfieldiana]